MELKSPIIFLNIDGVLISEEYILRLSKDLNLLYKKIGNRYFMKFELEKINLLKNIITETNSYIVIASSWNKDNNIKDIKNVFKEYDLDKRIIDITPYICKNRGLEVSEWINKNSTNFPNLNLEKFVIVDDQDTGILKDNHIQTNSKIGITDTDCKKIIKKLKGV